MKNENQITPTVELLISLKSFSKLTAAEKQMVLAKMSQDEYTFLHETALESTSILNHHDSFDDSSLKSNLLTAYDKKYSQPKKPSILMYNIPLYQAVAAIALIVITLAGFNYFSQKQDVAPQHVVYVEKKDTVYIPSHSVAVAPVNESKSSGDSAVANPKKGISSPIHQTQLNYTGNYHKEKEVASISLSHSIKQDSSLKQFMVASLN